MEINGRAQKREGEPLDISNRRILESISSISMVYGMAYYFFPQFLARNIKTKIKPGLEKEWKRLKNIIRTRIQL
jgi:hypothetical protein